MFVPWPELSTCALPALLSTPLYLQALRPFASHRSPPISFKRALGHHGIAVHCHPVPLLAPLPFVSAPKMAWEEGVAVKDSV